MDEIDERRRRADAAWEQFVRDAKHLGDAIGLEVEKVKRLGLEGVRGLGARPLFESHPLAFAGGAAALGFALGWRGGRRRSTLHAISRAGAEAIATLPTRDGPRLPEKGLFRRVVETAVLAALQRGAQTLAARAIDHLEEPRHAVSRLELPEH